MPLKVCEHQCDQCLFSKNRIVSAQRMKQILKDCEKKDDHFLCHKGTIVGIDVVCRGFYENKTSKVIRFLKWLGLSPDFVNPDTLIKENIKRVKL